MTRTAAMSPGAATRSHRLRTAPMVWWAAIGGLALIAQTIVFGRWLAAGGFHPVPTSGRTITRSWQITTWVGQLAVAIAVVVCVVVVWRQCRRAHRITLDAALVLGFGSAAWLLPMYSWRNLTMVENPFALNASTWGPYIPSWTGPVPGLQAATASTTLMMFLTVVWVWIQRWAVSRVVRVRPHWGIARRLLATVPFMMFVCWVLELGAILMSVYAYPFAPRNLSVFGGRWFQVPVINIVTMIMQPAAVVLMEQLADEKGRTIAVFRGADSLGRRATAVLRLLAGVGLCNVIALVFVGVFLTLTAAAGHDPLPVDFPRHMWLPN
ncbi:spirocyclase AveC family protein [Nocardia brasiliensis]|uniref:spirocyclase AveC family protein n=1 Tax=Nocardia brasiliensis TaxID=37326 RepID=UPI0033C1529A